MIDFPAAPVAGQLFFAGNGIVYQYSSTYTSWVAISSSAPQDGSFFAMSNAAFTPVTGVVPYPNVITGNAGGWFNTSNNRYTPPAGRYFIEAAVTQFATGAGSLTLELRKNGAVVIRNNDTIAANAQSTPRVSGIFDANGTDFFDINISGLGGSGYSGSTSMNFFQAFAVAQAVVPIGGGSAWRQVARNVLGGAQATIDFQNIPADINDLELRFDLTPVTDAVDLIARWYDAGGVLLSAGYGYTNAVLTNAQALASAPAVSNNASAGGISTGVMLNYVSATRKVDNVGGIRGSIKMNNIRDATRPKAIDWMGSYLSDDGTVLMNVVGSGWRGSVGGVTGLQLAFSSGNIAATSTATLWGSP